MTLEQLRYCLAAEKYHSFSKAADALYVSQSSISEAIHILEAELGLQLFVRTSKGVSPTPHGEKILAHARIIAAECNDIHSYASHHNAQSPTELKIGSAALFSTSVLQNLLVSLLEKAPTIKIKAETLTNREIIDGIHIQRLQYGLLGFRTSQITQIQEELTNKKIAFDALHSSQIYCYLSCSHPLADHTCISLAELTQFPLILHEHSCADLKPQLEAAGCTITETNDYELIKQLAAQAPMIALAPYIGGHQFSNASLCKIPQNISTDGVGYMYIRDNSQKGNAIDNMLRELLKTIL